MIGVIFVAFVLVVILYLRASKASLRYLNDNPIDLSGKVKPVFIGGKLSPLLTMIRVIRRTGNFKFWFSELLKFQPQLPMVIEILIVMVWSFYVGRNLLDFNANYMPRGGEFALSVSENYFWRDLLRCGSCALWNGRSIGGFQAFLDIQSAPLHPLFAIPTLLFDVINGAKVSVVLGLMLAGLAQLWLGYLLGLSPVARVWASLMAVVAGTITGRMEIGLTTLVVSTASGALVIPAGINLVQKPGLKAIVLFSLSMALLILAGQGYIQICVALSILPALLILCIGPKDEMLKMVKKIALAGGLTFLLCAVFLVPLLHNWPRVVKDTDEFLNSAQPIDYQLLNLFIHDSDFYQTNSLGKLPFPYTYTNFIGLTPLLFIFFAIRFVNREKLRYLFFFIVAIALVYLNSSAILPKLLFEQLNREFLIGLRNIPLMAGMAGPLILGLAAWGLDLVLKTNVLQITIGGKEQDTVSHIPLIGILLAVPIVASVITVYNFNQRWLNTNQPPDENNFTIQSIIPETSQWVAMPAENFWILPAYENDVKLLNAFHPFKIKDSAKINAYIEGIREDPNKPLAQKFFQMAGVAFVKNQENSYATLKTSQGEMIPCPALSRGGWIDINCPKNSGGELVVRENNWNGWYAYVNSQSVPMVTGPLLKLYLPAGQQTIQFRYIPWDVAVGLLLTLAGIVACIVLWRKT